ncbi:Thioesterase superfamily protein [Mariniphaga anaerophila]|uniref:Thioesterase superfamily protein n=1 Tax=Mariniphaga anaerophila TaxID=1484053 RepID=A0A1M4W1I5_9BACT|nr:acyl-CoA thioesterase [Mariniphaga anaerophila]SHE75025.1 Thioesterase superfamily protein [Mariniphaga anaerophila]
MENYKLVLPGDLNQNGYLYGGHLLKWIDEYAWIAATLEYPGSSFVTVGLDKVTFKRSVRKGAILKFVIEKSLEGNTSVQYFVNVYCQSKCHADMDIIFSTHITFVNLDENGAKKSLNSI